MSIPSSRWSGCAGVLDMFDEDEVALGNGVHNPACIVTERGAYSLATYMSRMERNPSASRQKSTLTQLLDAVAYLHGRSMVRSHPHTSALNLLWETYSTYSRPSFTIDSELCKGVRCAMMHP